MTTITSNITSHSSFSRTTTLFMPFYCLRLLDTTKKKIITNYQIRCNKIKNLLLIKINNEISNQQYHM